MNNESAVQYHIRCKKGDVGRYVFLPGDPARTDIIAAHFDDAHLVIQNREHRTWTGYLNGEKVSVTSTGMGGPSAAIAVEELIKIGADTFIRVGTAGEVCAASKDESVKGVICTAAIREDGTSAQYVPVEYPAVANRHVVDALVSAARQQNEHFLEGITHSKDSYYCEIDPDCAPNSEQLKQRWRVWERAGVMSSEMETAALFVLSTIRGKRAGAIMSFRDMDAAIRVACDAVKLLIEADRQTLG